MIDFIGNIPGNTATVFAIGGVAGAFVGTLLKDYLLPHYMKRREQRQELTALYQRYSDPLKLSALDLAYRIFSIIEDSPNDFLKSSVLKAVTSSPLETVPESNLHLRQYKLVSTIYRFCAFLGWLELYRQEVSLLHALNDEHTKQLEDRINNLRSDLADATPGTPTNWNTWLDRCRSKLIESETGKSPDWQRWKDSAIYREELRAIGETMIATPKSESTIVGYAHFTRLFESNDENMVSRWGIVVLNLLVGVGTVEEDFRWIRIQQFAIDLIEFIKVLVPDGVDERLQTRSDRLAHKLTLPSGFAIKSTNPH